MNKPFCPDCVGKCDIKHIVLKSKIVDDVCYFECSRCSNVFKLVSLDTDDKFYSKCGSKINTPEEASK